jgi:hypothetical protein
MIQGLYKNAQEVMKKINQQNKNILENVQSELKGGKKRTIKKRSTKKRSTKKCSTKK